MVIRNVKGSENEPEQKAFDLPSEKEHLFQVVDWLPDFAEDPDVVFAKLEVVGGNEEGRTMLNRMTLNDEAKGFWATRLFLKAIGEQYKGTNFEVDTDHWIGRQFYATVVHNGKYANIKEYNFEKKVEQFDKPIAPPKDEIAWS